MYNLRREIVVIGDLNFNLCLDHNHIKKFKESVPVDKFSWKAY